MGRNIFLLAVIIFLFAAITPKTVDATYENISASSAGLVQTPKPMEQDNRAKILQAFLTSYNSPLAEYAQDFVQEADKNKLDWKLVAAISGVESGFGNAIPPYSYNGWGWGIFGNNVYRFTSWQEAIQVISKGLRENYINKLNSDNIYAIGSIYASDPEWAGKVTSFMKKIDNFALQNGNKYLPISL